MSTQQPEQPDTKPHLVLIPSDPTEAEAQAAVEELLAEPITPATRG
jgi:hypothetical protein